MIFDAPKSGAADDDGDSVSETGEEQCFLHGGVATADDDDVLAAEEKPVARRAPRHSPSRQAFLIRQAELLVRGSGCEDHGRRLVGVPTEGCDGLGVSGELDGGGVVVSDDRAEAFGLLAEVLHQFRSLDAVREAGEVLDLGRVHQGPTGGDRSGDHPRRQSGAGGVDRRRITGGTGAHDDDLLVLNVRHDSASQVHFWYSARRAGAAATPSCRGVLVGRSSLMSRWMRPLISSRIGRMDSTPLPARSSRTQASYRLPGK